MIYLARQLSSCRKLAMSLLIATNLSKSFGAVDLFRDVSFTISPGARLALVGPNGCGKTTLLRILLGVEEPSAGTVRRAKSLRIGYLPQEVTSQLDGTLWDSCQNIFADLLALQRELEHLEREMANQPAHQEILARYGLLQEEFEQRGGYTFPTRVRQVLSGLGFTEKDFYLPLAHLSGGQRTRACLAHLLLADPDLLLLDEPTNHLDLAAVEWLENYLHQWKGAAVIVSHDRYFLDRVANGILEMVAGVCEYYAGNYSAYLRTREQRWEHRLETFEAEKARLLQEVEYIKKNIAGQNANQAKGRLRRVSRLVQAIEQRGWEHVRNRPWAETAAETTVATSPFRVEEAERRVRALTPPRCALPRLRLTLRAAPLSGEIVLRTSNLLVGYPERPLFRVPEIVLRRGECAAILGPNGAGKTTFLKTILAQIPPLEGEVTLGASLHIGYFAQAHEGLDPNRTLFDEIASLVPHWLPGQIRDYLGKYLFSGDDVFKKVALLSGGERGRLALAKLALQETNLLLLDEPTNHLDIPSQEVLQSVLDDFEGTILLVTHDRYLVDALATQIWEIDLQQASLDVFDGTYSQRREERQRLAMQALLTNAACIRESREGESPSTARQKRETQKAERRRLARLQELEDNIIALEQELDSLAAQLESPPADATRVTELGREYARIQQARDELLAEWEALA